MLSNIRREIRERLDRDKTAEKKNNFVKNGMVPWSEGYMEYRWDYIDRALKNPSILAKAARGEVSDEFGIGLDERCVEYAWCLGNLTKIDGKVLDAGSALNYRQIINAANSAERKLTIAGLAVEKNCYYTESVSYQLCDLRNLPFRDNWFDVSLSISTLEHISMDNAIYGHGDSDNSSAAASPVRDGYIAALREISRVTTPDGTILISVPCGRFENHGFFQQFDRTMLDDIVEILESRGELKVQYFKYTEEGWKSVDWERCANSVSHNPHTGKGKGNDGAAHCRAVACFKSKGYT